MSGSIWVSESRQASRRESGSSWASGGVMWQVGAEGCEEE